MAIRHVVTLGFRPYGTGFIPTLGFTPRARLGLVALSHALAGGIVTLETQTLGGIALSHGRVEGVVAVEAQVLGDVTLSHGLTGDIEIEIRPLLEGVE